MVVLSAVILLAGGLAFIVLPGLVPNPGHSLTTAQGYFRGDASLLDSLGKVQQRISDNCPEFQGISSVGIEGTVTCETGLQQRVSGECPTGHHIWRINANGSVDCEPDEASDIDTTDCPEDQYVTSVNSNGSVECSPSPALSCAWANNTFSTGDLCNPRNSCSSVSTNRRCRCQSNGTWSCFDTGLTPCPPRCSL